MALLLSVGNVNVAVEFDTLPSISMTTSFMMIERSNPFDFAAMDPFPPSSSISFPSSLAFEAKIAFQTRSTIQKKIEAIEMRISIHENKNCSGSVPYLPELTHKIRCLAGIKP